MGKSVNFSGLFSHLHISHGDRWWKPSMFLVCKFICTVHTVHGVLKARILKWLVIPFSSGPHSVRTKVRLVKAMVFSCGHVWI